MVMAAGSGFVPWFDGTFGWLSSLACGRPVGDAVTVPVGYYSGTYLSLLLVCADLGLLTVFVNFLIGSRNFLSECYFGCCLSWWSGMNIVGSYACGFSAVVVGGYQIKVFMLRIFGLFIGSL